jgi:DNA-binding winged helix-turn-helix (wHTH) protein
MTIGVLHLNLEERSIKHYDKNYHLTNQEFIILIKLVERLNKVVPKEYLLKELWPDLDYLRSKDFSMSNLIST